MILKTNLSLLYIEPSENVPAKPLIDIVTRKMVAALRAYVRTGVLHRDGFFAVGHATRGTHFCRCGNAGSSNKDFELSNGLITNSMCIHYVACHREEIDQSVIDQIMAFTDGEAEPTDNELEGRIWLDQHYKDKEGIILQRANT